MSGTAFALVMSAAVLHALWNALVKAAGDRGLILALIATGHVILGGIAALFLPLPEPASWPYIAASTVIHWLYYFLIFHAYRMADLSLVYPISRGIAPVLVGMGGAFWLGEVLPGQAWAGVIAVSLGVVLVAWRSMFSRAASPSVLIALATGATIAAYSVVDGAGVRLSGGSLSYIAWLFLLEVFVVLWLVSRRRLAFLQMGVRAWLVGLAGGLASATAYGLAIHAKTLAPVGLVSALRETSVVIAAAIGVIWLGERPWRPRVLAAMIVAAGVALIALI
jgi:drug/metabolite transporter (DMT)-like permease